MVILYQAKEIVDVLSIENITIFGVLIGVIILLIYERNSLEKRNDKEHDKLYEIIKNAQDKLEHEFRETNNDLKLITEKYHVFTVQVFEKLKSILNNYK